VRRTYEQSGRLRSYAGQIVEMDRGNVSVALRSGVAVSLRPDWIVNCSGVGRASTMGRDPLIGGMLVDGMVLAEPRGFGLHANQDLVAIGALGLPTERLWITGPPVRGSRFEATAVPELRIMAELVASGILAKLNSASRARVIQSLDSEGSG
jgi:uncharacterized NAD(P)/FAD-binding protein YdhS